MTPSPPPTTSQTEASLASRFSSKLISNILSLGFTFLQYSIAPRLLGPAAYGDFSFLKHFFDKLFGLLDSGTSLAFYTKLSKNISDHSIKNFYWIFAASILLISITICATLFFFNFNLTLWPHASSSLILLALIASFTYWTSQIINKIIDAHALTIPGEIWRTSQRAIAAALISLLFIFSLNSLHTFFLFQITTFLILSFGWVFILKKNNLTCFYSPSTPSSLKHHSKDFWNYSSPLILYAIIGFLCLTFDRWLLQLTTDSTHQGHYSLAYQIGALCFLFSSAITPLFMRDFAKLSSENNPDKALQLFSKTLPLFYTISCYFAAFIFINAKYITLIVGGNEFLAATPVIALMAFYPIHQTYGQLCAGVFYATNNTKRYRNIGITGLLIGLAISLFLLLPKNYGGLLLGPYGLAIKMISFQFITVNIQLFFLSKQLKFNFTQFFIHQFLALIPFLILAKISFTLTSSVLNPSIYLFLLNGLLYSTLVLSLIYLAPAIIGLKKFSLKQLLP